MRKDYLPLLIAALGLALLPFILDPLGLPLRSSIDVVVFAVACLGLNVLVGYTGLVSFGHGAWFGLGAYAAALSQLNWFPGGVILPMLLAVRSEEHTSELQSRQYLVCRLLLEKKKGKRRQVC